MRISCGHCSSKFIALSQEAAWNQFAFHVAAIHCLDFNLPHHWQWAYIRKATKPMTKLEVTQCWN